MKRNEVINSFRDAQPEAFQFSDPKIISRRQNTLFQKHMDYVFAHSPYYREKYRELGITRKDIRSVKDITKLPFTEKSDLNAHNADFLASPANSIADVCLTSGTTSETPTRFLLTESDLARLAYNEEIAFKTAGVTKNDTMIVCAALDRCFMAGLAYFLGTVRIGACAIRSGAGEPAQHWQLMKTLHITSVVGVPSLIRRIGEYARQNNEDPSKIGIKRIVAIGESIRDKNLSLLDSARTIEEMWNARIYSTYASTELATTFCECEARCGGHFRPELIVIEIVDGEGRSLPDHEAGEVVITPLGITGMPLVRFKPGDVSFIISEQCACGRKTKRIGPILGRKNQMLKYKGTTVFPDSILSVVEGREDVYGGYIEASSNPDGTDCIVLYIAPRGGGLPESEIEGELRAKIRVVPRIRIISREDFDKAVYLEGKRKRANFFDLRRKNG